MSPETTATSDVNGLKWCGMKVIEIIANILYSLVSIALIAIALSMIGYAGWEVWQAVGNGTNLAKRMLDAVGLLVISVAVFDVAKYLMEEEVLRDRELRSPREARETLTKFIVILTIAVGLEALVFIFGAGKEDVNDLLYPTLLLISTAIVIVSLGVYQRLSLVAEVRKGK